MGDLWSHKALMVFGAVLFALGRPMFAATGWVHATYGVAGILTWLSVARLVDKVTKGFRDTPMKALIAQKAGPNKAAGLASKAAYQNLANAAGGLAASWLFAVSGASYTTCFLFAVVPAVAAAVICAALPDPEVHDEPHEAARDAGGAPAGGPSGLSPGGYLSRMRSLPPAYWQAAAVFSVLMLARFEASFVNIHIAWTGVSRTLIPTMVSLNMMVAFLASKLSGAWVSCGDLHHLSGGEVRREHLRRRGLALGVGYVALAGANASFGLLGQQWGMWLGWALVGAHMGLTHSLIGATLQSYAPPALAGTAFSIFDIVSASFLFAGNLWAGQLSDLTSAAGHGPVGCFALGFAAVVASGALLAAAHLFGDMGRPEYVQLGKLKRGGGGGGGGAVPAGGGLKAS